MYELAARIENGCGDEDESVEINAVALGTLITALAEATREVVASAEQLIQLARAGREPLPEIAPLPQEQLQSWLLAMREKLAGNDVLDDVQIRQLRQCLSDQLTPAQLEELCHGVENFDYSVAIVELDRLLAGMAEPPAANRMM